MNTRASILALIAFAGCSSPTVDSMKSTVVVDRPAGVVADGKDHATITVTLLDADGKPMPAIVLSLTATGDGNQLNQPVFTGADGTAVGTIASTIAATKTITVTIVVSGVSSTLSAMPTVQFVAGPADPGKSTFKADPSMVAADGVTPSKLTLALADANGNPVQGQAAMLASTGTSNSFTPAMGKTDVNGVFTATLASTKAEQKTVTATFGGAGATTKVSFLFGLPSTKNSTLTAAPAAVTADGVAASMLVATVRDASGNVIPGQQVVLSATGSTNTIAPSMGMTDASGTFTATISSTKAEAKTVTATIGAATANATVTFAPGPPSAMNSSLMANPASATADGMAKTTLTATLKDAQGNLVVGQAVAMSSTGSGNVFASPVGMTDASGSFTTTLVSTKAQAKMVTATFGPSSANATVTFVPGPPSAITSSLVANPTKLLADGVATTTLTTTVQDAQGNPVSGQAVTLSSTGSLNTITPAMGATDGSGVFKSTMSSLAGEQKTVTAAFGGANASSVITFISLPPSVKSISPGIGPTTGGTALTLVGSNFQMGAKVTIAGLDAAAVWVSPMKLSATLPAKPGALGKVAVVVTNPDAQSVSRADLFAYYSGALSFGAAVNNSSGEPYNQNTGPHSVVLADVNGDGTMDVTIANNDNLIGVFFNNGFGALAAAVNYGGGGNQPWSIALSDVNGDNKPDIAVANANGGSSTVSVLLNNGVGTFAAPVALNDGGNNPHGVAFGDVNGDGKLDLAAANWVSGDISVFLGNGNGTFAAAAVYGAGAGAISLAIGDVSGDGKADIAVANYSSNTVSVLVNNGAGTFGAAANYGVGVNPSGIAIGDFNGDALADLAVANYSSGTVSVLINNAGNGFLGAVNYNAGQGSISVALADMNGDGKTDLAVADTVANTVSVLLNNGNGTFAAPVNYASGTSPWSIAVGDLNADGKPDFVTANAGSNDVSVFLNTSM